MKHSSLGRNVWTEKQKVCGIGCGDKDGKATYPVRGQGVNGLQLYVLNPQAGNTAT